MSARLTISLAALQENYARLAAAAPGGVAAVVKADAYGLGAVQVLPALQRAGCEEFFVATIAEGVALRAASATAIIYVLNGLGADDVDACLHHRLVPVLNSPAQCERWLPTAQPCAVHVDTGMQRLGLTAAEFAQLDRGLRCELIVSHLARADEPEHGANAEQVARLLAAHDLQRFPDARLCMSNSAGTLTKTMPNDQLSRAGIGLYGGNPYVDRLNPMVPVVQVEARVLRVREVPPATPIGYGGTAEFSAPTTVAVVGAGYADGIPWRLSNGGRAYFAGQEGCVVGRVSMDSVHVHFRSVVPVEGDWVELLGPNVGLDDMARIAGTIGYEILTRLSTRSERRYVEQLLT
ncbi:MAG: alanine racemase [Pseudomonadota bacterium]